MKKVLKRIAGIDVDLKLLVCCFGEMYDDTKQVIISHKTFDNNLAGFGKLLAYCNALSKDEIQIRFVFEATGTYHEKLAYFLVDNSQNVSIILPRKISNYARTLENKTVTDKISSEAIMFFGLGRNLDNWYKPSPIYKSFQQLTRERTQIVADRSAAQNRLHAENHEANPNKSSLLRIKAFIKFLKEQEAAINKEIRDAIKANEEVAKNVKLLCTIDGIGLLTAITILAETNAFELIKNKKQLASYAGFDVKQKQSGTSVHGKSRISKQGNSYLRAAMYFPSLTAKRTNKNYSRIQEDIGKKSGIKMKGYVALQRRLLEMCYTIFKSQVAFDPNYETKKQKTNELIMEVA